jgi:Sec-independent protein translocase protein TatA
MTVVTIPHIPMLAILGGGGEIALILVVLLVLLVARRLPEIGRGLLRGISEFSKEIDRQAHDAGKSAGGIFGKPAAEALTPDNKTGELYDPAAFRPAGRNRSVRQRLRHLWRELLRWHATVRFCWAVSPRKSPKAALRSVPPHESAGDRPGSPHGSKA